MSTRLRQTLYTVALVVCLLGIYVAGSAQAPGSSVTSSTNRAGDTETTTVIDTDTQFSWQVVVTLLGVCALFVTNKLGLMSLQKAQQAFTEEIKPILNHPETGLCVRTARLEDHKENPEIHIARADVVTRLDCQAMHSSLMREFREELRANAERRSERDREIERQIQSAIDGMETLRRTFVAAMGHGAAG